MIRTVPNSPKLKRQVAKLKQPANRTKNILNNKLLKSKERFSQEAKKSDTENGKNGYLKKVKRIGEQLKLLKELSEEELIVFALTEKKNLMEIATNKRLPASLRLKARIACHKPLSSHLRRVKAELEHSEEEDKSSENDEKPEILDKIKFNNEIISLRSKVRRSKIHVIHKLTRNINKTKLLSSKSKDDKKSFFDQKAEKLVKVIKYIKEHENDDISRFALSNTQNMDKLLSDAKLPSSTRAKILVARHKFVAEPVEDFKKKFLDWKTTVPILLKKKKKKSKLIKTNENTADSKASTKLPKKPQIEQSIDNEYSENECENSEEEEKEEEDDENERRNQIEESDENIESGEEDSNVSDQSGTENDDGNLSTNSIESNSEEDTVACNIEASKKSTNKAVFKDKKRKFDESLTGLIKKNKTESVRPIEAVDVSLFKSITKTKTLPTVKVVDPFFMTATNEEYVTSQVPALEDSKSTFRNHNQDSNKSKSNQFNSKNKWNQQTGNEWVRNVEDKWKKNDNWQTKKFGDSKPFKNSFEKSLAPNKRPLGILGNRKERRKELQQPLKEEKPEKLHPSWEAKKKQSTIIVGFQGKKIKFD